MKRKYKLYIKADSSGTSNIEFWDDNSKYYGVFWTITPDKSIDHGMFSVTGRNNGIHESPEGKALEMWSINPLGLTVNQFMTQMGFKLKKIKR